MTKLHEKRYPGESDEYRRARNALLAAEQELRARTEAVAAQRRALPPGGALPRDYVFAEGPAALGGGDDPRQVRFSGLFAPGKDTLVLYSFMYGPDWEQPCPLCTSLLDSLNGSAPHIADQVNLAVVARAPLPKLRAWARQRNWDRLRLLSSADNTYNADYFAEDGEGGQWPLVNVFRRDGGDIRHCWASELFFLPGERGQDTRHVDTIWPLWNVLDMTPQGRGEDWYPRLDYGSG